ncbi:MAG: hypothetical protein NTY86_04630, partial [Deltaproteobacteria bacterium]|nr:hypothetical protein [Deltaproteobacteria bacterium]
GCPLQPLDGLAQSARTKADGNQQRRWLGAKRPSHRLFRWFPDKPAFWSSFQITLQSQIL